MNGPERARQTRWQREMDELKARQPKPEPPRPRNTKAEQALDSLLRSAKGLGQRTNGYGETMSFDYITHARLSRDGDGVIVRLSPAQALRLCDLISENED